MFNSKMGSILALVTILLLMALAGVPLAFTQNGQPDLPAFAGIVLFTGFLPLAIYRVFQAFKHGEADSAKIALDDTQIFKRSRAMTLVILCAAIGFVFSGYSMVKPSDTLWPGFSDASSVIGWVAIGFFGLCLLTAIAALFWQGPVLTLSPEGINCSIFKVGVIDWQDVRDVQTKKMMRSQAISLDLRDPEKYFARGYPKRARSERIARHFGMSPFSFSGEMFGTTSEYLLSELMPRFRKFGTSATTQTHD